MRILSGGIVRTRHDSCNNAPNERRGRWHRGPAALGSRLARNRHIPPRRHPDPVRAHDVAHRASDGRVTSKQVVQHG